MALKTDMRVILSGAMRGPGAFGGQTYAPVLDQMLSLPSGVGAGQADILWTDEPTLAASASLNLDLAGVLSDAFGATVIAAKLVGLLIIAAAGNTNDVLVGGAATNGVPIFNALTDVARVKAGGWLYLVAPGLSGLCIVTPGTADILKIANSGGVTGVSYKIAAIARSA